MRRLVVPGKPKVIKFSMAEDEKTRSLGKKAHQIAASLKEAGFPVKSMMGSIDSFEIRKQFKLPRKNSFSLLEFVDNGEEKNLEIVDWININISKVRVFGSGAYKYTSGDEVFRVIVDCTKM